MAVTQNTYTGNGSTTNYSFTFPYLETTDIKVSLNGTVTTAYTLANATTIQFNTAPANGAAIRIYRQTDDAALAATFYPGSAIRSQDLNENFTQNLYVTQESINNAATANTTANTALTNSNTAISTANSAVSTANTASSNASAAVSTANTASSNASAAVSTANTASSNATTAVNTANAATATANSATSTANTALSTANAATSTANAASTAATNAVNTANAASSAASSAVSTANTASTNASNAVTTANTASTNATTAVNTANTAVTTANAAAAAVANAVLYTTVANVAAIPASPANNTAIEVTNSTGIESFTPLSGLPVGFVGSSGLSVRIIYQTTGSTWTWIQYFPNDPESRYLKLSGGTLTGQLRADDSTSVASPVIAFDGDTNTGVAHTGADELALVTGGSARLTIDGSGNVAVPGTLGVTGAITGSSTVTGTALIPSGSTAPTNGVYLPAANSVAISTNGTARLTITSDGDIRTTWGNDRFLGSYFSSSYYQGILFDGGNSKNLKIVNRSGDTSADIVFLNAINGAPTEKLRITSAGLVGVGTSTPGMLIHGAKAGAAGLKLQNTANSVTGFLEAGTSNVDFGTETNHNLDFYTNGSFRARLDTSGRLGIGTTPNYLLHLATGTSGTADLALDGGTDAGKGPLLLFRQNGTSKWFIGTDSTINSGTSDDLDIYTAGARALRIYTNNAERARIDSSGRLLVGTSTNAPSDTLFVVHGQPGNANEPAVAQLRRGGTILADYTLGQVSFADGSGNVAAHIRGVAETGWGGSGDAPGRLVFSTTADGASSPSERWRIDSSGSLVGVAGSAFVAPYVYNTTTATAANVNVDATGFLRRSTSSIKYKTNVETIQDQYADAILGCRPVWYQSTCEADKPEWGHWGFIAEEVAEIDPRLCFFKEEEDGTLEPEGVQYDRFVPHLLNLIKRQGEAIAELQAEVAALKVQ